MSNVTGKQEMMNSKTDFFSQLDTEDKLFVAIDIAMAV